MRYAILAIVLALFAYVATMPLRHAVDSLLLAL